MCSPSLHFAQGSRFLRHLIGETSIPKIFDYVLEKEFSEIESTDGKRVTSSPSSYIMVHKSDDKVIAKDETKIEYESEAEMCCFAMLKVWSTWPKSLRRLLLSSENQVNTSSCFVHFIIIK
ncbi:hypothetical protein L6452_01407 [Arctium lappa]|uniref:Uncharacterized protein n=1 Tax=Arctium lappa TaxID=4217 RepID=A0ACB9FGM1_ARCLA|nr:hypothetical protein L6452_01407 [Arctium lappa]